MSESTFQRASQDAVQAGVLAAAHLLRHRADAFVKRADEVQASMRWGASHLATELRVRAKVLRDAADELEADANAALGDSPEALALRKHIRSRVERNLRGT